MATLRNPAPDNPARVRRPGRSLAILLGLAGLARLALIVATASSSGLAWLPDDPDNYLPLARSLASGEGFAQAGRPTAYRPPLYPMLLVPFVAAIGPGLGWGIAGLHLVLGVGTVALTAWTARRWGLGHRQALIAAAIVAFDPVLVVQVRAVMTETFAAFLTALALAATALGPVRGPFASGLTLGLATLCRPSSLAVAGLTSLASALASPGRWRLRTGRALALAVATVLVLVPWAWRNARVLGEPVWTTTHGGYTLALANNSTYYDQVLHGPPGAVWTGDDQWRWWDRITRGTAGLPEPEADRVLRDSALRTIAAPPRATSPARAWRGWLASGASPPRARSIQSGSARRPRPGPSRSGWPSSPVSPGGKPGAGPGRRPRPP